MVNNKITIIIIIEKMLLRAPVPHSPKYLELQKCNITHHLIYITYTKLPNNFLPKGLVPWSYCQNVSSSSTCWFYLFILQILSLKYFHKETDSSFPYKTGSSVLQSHKTPLNFSSKKWRQLQVGMCAITFSVQTPPLNCEFNEDRHDICLVNLVL